MSRFRLTLPPQCCLLMGIVNVTPDSFSGDGLGHESDVVAAAAQQAVQMIEAGADILDIGGESTRPGSAYVPSDVEIARVLPVIERLRAEHPDVAISADTYKADVAEAALAAGADVINDVWALQADPRMTSVVRAADCPVVLMHNRSKPGHAENDRLLGGSYVAPEYGPDFLSAVLDEMHALADAAVTAGIAVGRIVLDPGVGFGKTPAQNMALIEGLDRIKALGFPVLLGASRKSFMGRVLGLEPGDRLETTLATTALGVARGADIVRVHDVPENWHVLRMTEEMLAAGRRVRKLTADGGP